MKKRFLVAAMAATMVSPLAAYAEATVYGNVHVSIDSYDSEDNLDMNSNTSAVGVKGKEDLGGGLSAIFKVEFQVDPTEREKNITDRDQWVGLKGAMGTFKFGTMTNNYKMMGGKIDPMYRTQLEGRGFMNTQSTLHSGAGQNGGRSTNTLQYASPKMGGIQAVFNYTVSGSDDETMGLGIHYETKTVTAYVDYLKVQGPYATYSFGSVVPAGESEAAYKIGGSFAATDALTLALQYEKTEDVIGSDIIFASVNFMLNDNDSIALTLGDVDEFENMGYALMYNHNMSQRTNVYVGYGDNADIDVTAKDVKDALAANTISQNDYDDIIGLADEQVLTVGMRHKF